MKPTKPVMIGLTIALGVAGVAGLCFLAIPYYEANAYRTSAESDIAGLQERLAHFKQDNHRYPSTQEGLAALFQAPEELKGLWKGPYLEHPVPNDPWGHPYVYQGARDSFTVTSYGPDGRPGGNGINADITGGNLQ